MRKILLALDHTHNGVKYYAGSVIELPDQEAEFVVNTSGAVREQQFITPTVEKAEEEDVRD